MKHTPGPWEPLWSMSARNYHHIVVNDGELIAMVDACAPTDGDMEEEGKANARLIAAAPELLEALQDMYAGWKYIRSTHGSLYGVGWDRCDASARAALKKAGIE